MENYIVMLLLINMQESYLRILVQMLIKYNIVQVVHAAHRKQYEALAKTSPFIKLSVLFFFPLKKKKRTSRYLNG